MYVCVCVSPPLPLQVHELQALGAEICPISLSDHATLLSAAKGARKAVLMIPLVEEYASYARAWAQALKDSGTIKLAIYVRSSHIDTHTHAFTHTFTYTLTHIHIHTTHPHTFTYTHTHTTHSHTLTHSHTHHIHTHSHIHTYPHAHTQQMH